MVYRNNLLDNLSPSKIFYRDRSTFMSLFRVSRRGGGVAVLFKDFCRCKQV